MKYGIKEITDATIYNEDGFPILILDNINNNLDIDLEGRSISLNLDLETESAKEVINILNKDY